MPLTPLRNCTDPAQCKLNTCVPCTDELRGVGKVLAQLNRGVSK